MSQGKSGVIDAESVILALDGLKKLRKSIWNTVAILPSLEDLSRYDESFGYTGHPLDADTGKLSRELMNMAKSISAFINMNKKYVA